MSVRVNGRKYYNWHKRSRAHMPSRVIRVIETRQFGGERCEELTKK